MNRWITARIDIQIQLDKQQPVFTSEDVISGHVILYSEVEVDIATITINLSGTATSRLDSGKLTESHKLFNRNEQIFPPSTCGGGFTSAAVTLCPGEHSFPFSIQFPPVMECYKNSTADAARKQAAAREPSHLIRKLPPSSGNKCTPDEIKYTLEASVVQQGLLRWTQKATRNVPFHPLSTIRQPIRSLKISKNVNLRVKAAELPRSPLTYEVEVELKNGPFLLLGHPIALEITIKHTNGEKNTISLQAFQTLLRERTGIRACGSIQSFTRSWVIQTMANLRQPLVAENQPTVGSVLKLDDRLWSRHCVPAHLGPTFETCNLGRSYELEVRLGIQFGRNHVSRYDSIEAEILEFEFPAYVSVPSFTRFTRSCVGGLGPKRDRCETQALEKA